jgi:hypothetical protein
MFSAIYDGTIGEVSNKFGERIIKPASVIRYTFMKGVDRAGQYLSYCTILKKCSEKAVISPINYA